MLDLTQFQGRRGWYYRTTAGSVYGPMRYVCLNCTAYFRTKCCRTQINRGTHEGTMQTRFCPCCGAELTHLVKPTDKNQLTIDGLE